MEISLDGWDIKRFDQEEWVPWGGASGDARAKVLGVADGFYLALIEAQPGYRGVPHEHKHPEFLSVIDGEVRNQGGPVSRGGGSAGARGSTDSGGGWDTGASSVVVVWVWRGVGGRARGGRAGGRRRRAGG